MSNHFQITCDDASSKDMSQALFALSTWVDLEVLDYGAGGRAIAWSLTPLS